MDKVPANIVTVTNEGTTPQWINKFIFHLRWREQEQDWQSEERTWNEFIDTTVITNLWVHYKTF